MLKAFLESLDSLDEGQKSLYKETTGGFVLNVEPANGYGLENVAPLRSALEQSKANQKSLKDKLDTFAIDGELITPEAAIQAIKQVKKLTENPDDKKAAIEAAVEQATSELTSRLKTSDDDIASLEKQLTNALIDQRATAELGKREANINLLLPHIKSQLRLNKMDDGTRNVEVVGADGNARIHYSDGKTEPMTLSHLIDEMAENPDFMPAFKGSGHSGSGGSGDTDNKNQSRSGTVTKTELATGKIGSLEDVAAGKVTVVDG